MIDFTTTGRVRPPCPTCRQQVTRVVAESPDDLAILSDTTRMAARPRDYTLDPCGHRILSFTIEASGDVTELRTSD